MVKVLVTGAAGFIGSRLVQVLAERGDEVFGIDNINDYYDVRLKYARLREIGISCQTSEMPFCKIIESSVFPNLRFMRMNIEEKQLLDRLFDEGCFDKIVHLAAQAGVRYSITHPYSYMQSNLVGFLNILEACRNYGVAQMVFASSSSVYGLNEKVPFNEDDKVDTPVSLYAASKKSNELMAHCYSKLYGMRMIGLRYFTVYGPWGRPDMSPMLFADAIRRGEPIRVFNNGDMMRDYTYIDDVVDGTIHALDHNLVKEQCPNGVLYKIYNIGCGHPVRLLDFIDVMEKSYGKTTEKLFLPMQPGDVQNTFADTGKLEQDMGYCPVWTIENGVEEFVKWYKSKKNPLQ
jgi:UDP-glucuronate 4-epimerase